MRHVPRNHKVALHWLFDRIVSDPKNQMNYVDTKNQLADTLAKESFTRDELNHHLRLLNIMDFSMFSCIHFNNGLSDLIRKQSVISKNGQPRTSEESSRETQNQLRGEFCVSSDGSRTFVPISWMCKKQTFVSHSSAKSEVIATIRVAKLTSQSRKLWLVGVSTDRDARHF